LTKKNAKTDASTPSAEASTPQGTTETQAAAPIDLSAPGIQEAIAKGRVLIAEGKSKADAAREIFQAISGESKEVIVAAFVDGATLTPKGALTYWYNCRRRASKQK